MARNEERREDRSGSSSNVRDEPPTDVQFGRHAGYGDYGEEDYGGSYGGLGDSGGGRDYSLGSGTRRDLGAAWPRERNDHGFERRDYGANPPRSFRGRGPKGYARSDERLREAVCEKLTDDPNIDAGDITVTVQNQVVTLDGTVDDRWTKYQVEELVERCGGVKDVRNQLRTRRTGQDSGSSASAR